MVWLILIILGCVVWIFMKGSRWYDLSTIIECILWVLYDWVKMVQFRFSLLMSLLCGYYIHGSRWYILFNKHHTKMSPDTAFQNSCFFSSVVLSFQKTLVCFKTKQGCTTIYYQCYAGCFVEKQMCHNYSLTFRFL